MFYKLHKFDLSFINSNKVLNILPVEPEYLILVSS